jgi:hypothetical protein
MYCTHWFNTIFAYSLPFEQLLRVWDVFLLEGMKVSKTRALYSVLHACLAVQASSRVHQSADHHVFGVHSFASTSNMYMQHACMQAVLPFEQLLRMWDVFLLEGMKVGS